MKASIRSILAAIRDNERKYLEARGQGKAALAQHYLGIANALAESIRY